MSEQSVSRRRLYRGEAGIDVVGQRKILYARRGDRDRCWSRSSASVFRGFNLGIEFTGGNSFSVPGLASARWRRPRRASTPRSEPTAVAEVDAPQRSATATATST